MSKVGLALVFIALGGATVEAARLGRLTGVVYDTGTGAPLVGASVAIIDVRYPSEAPVRKAKTDDEGKFTASVAPGRYILRAVASGFDTVETHALVVPNRETKIDSLLLRRVDTLADQRRPSADPYLDAVRTARRTGLNFKDEAQRDEAEAKAIALTESRSSTHGILQTGFASGTSGSSFSNFAIAHRTLGSELMVAGQSTTGDGIPSRLEAVTKTGIGRSHEVTVAFGYGAIPQSESRLSQYTVEATDSWQVAGPLVLVYGINYSRFAGSSDADSITPRFGVEVAASPQTQIFARLTPASDLEEVEHFDLESGEITFAEQPPTPVVDAFGTPVADRSRRFEVGMGRLLSEQSNVEVVAFVDSASGRGVGLLAVPVDGIGDREISTGQLNGRSSGLRVLYTRRLNKLFSGTVGYATGRAPQLRIGDDPVDSVVSTSFNVFAARIEAEFDSGTHISAIYRLSPNTVVFAIDPFAGRLATYRPGTSFVVTQSLPSFGFIPGHMEASLDVRNLFDTRPTADDEAVIAAYSRLVRAGLSLRF